MALLRRVPASALEWIPTRARDVCLAVKRRARPASTRDRERSPAATSRVRRTPTDVAIVASMFSMDFAFPLRIWVNGGRDRSTSGRPDRIVKSAGLC